MLISLSLPGDSKWREYRVAKTLGVIHSDKFVSTLVVISWFVASFFILVPYWLSFSRPYLIGRQASYDDLLIRIYYIFYTHTHMTDNVVFYFIFCKHGNTYYSTPFAESWDKSSGHSSIRKPANGNRVDVIRNFHKKYKYILKKKRRFSSLFSISLLTCHTSLRPSRGMPWKRPCPSLEMIVILLFNHIFFILYFIFYIFQIAFSSSSSATGMN